MDAGYAPPSLPKRPTYARPALSNSNNAIALYNESLRRIAIEILVETHGFDEEEAPEVFDRYWVALILVYDLAAAAERRG